MATFIPTNPDDWPCRTVPDRDVPPRLVAALYRFLRDYVHPGDAEQILLDIRKSDERLDYTNHHLEQLARAHATYLMRVEPSKEPRAL